jgi:DNA-binding LacI/PurR family transcriptional regulator
MNIKEVARLVFLDTGTPRKGISNISVDYAVGIDAAVEHLRELGHTSIGFISGPTDLTSAKVRRKAFLASIKRKGVNPLRHPCNSTRVIGWLSPSR